jgi:alpha-L-fucosidase
MGHMQWWSDARFGMFIHWGVYAIPARGEWVMYQEHIPHEEYAPLAKQFTPNRYDADEWVRLAKSAGMKYMVLTSRHHDGFSLFDSQYSNFTAPKTAAKRDLLREYVEACHRGGMRVGFYYSLLDWRYPAYFRGPQKDPEGWAELVDYVHAQVRELCSNYGQLDILWYDGGWPYTAEDWRSEELNAMARSLQPDIIINNRSQTPEDFDTPEQHVSASKAGRHWEACMTLNDSWGYNEADDNWKTAKQALMYLVRCAHGGGNFLLNVGPKADGSIPKESERVLQDVGKWLDRNGGSIYGTTRATVDGTAFGTSTGLSTVRGNTLYMHVFRWPGREITFSRIGNRVRSVHLLESGNEVKFEQRDDRVMLNGLPRRAPNDLDTVLVFELEGTPQPLDYFRDGWQPAEEDFVSEEIIAPDEDTWEPIPTGEEAEPPEAHTDAEGHALEES